MMSAVRTTRHDHRPRRHLVYLKAVFAGSIEEVALTTYDELVHTPEFVGAFDRQISTLWIEPQSVLGLRQQNPTFVQPTLTRQSF